MSSKNKPRTTKLVPNDNKTFSVGIPIAVDSHFHNLGFEGVFGPLKSKGVDINSLARRWPPAARRTPSRRSSTRSRTRSR